jgi:AcrR family transcriptional regulator
VTTEIPEPPWRQERKPARRRQVLSRELVLETALRILDADGLDALSMRRVAQELATGPASLYAHVANKDELLELLVERILAEVTIPVADPERWQEQVMELAVSVRGTLVAHRDIARATLARIPVSENGLAVGEGLLAILRAGGVQRKAAAMGVDCLSMFVTIDAIEGAAQAQSGRPAGQEDVPLLAQIKEFFQALPRDRFPNTVDLADELISGDGDERFAFGLDLMIRGLASYTAPE